MDNAAENERLSAYLDGELTAAEQAQVEQLLAASPAARQLLDELRTLSTTLQSLPQQKLGEDLGPQVLRLAERRMLTEPPSADAQTQPAKFPLPSWRETLRGMLGTRALVWSGLAVAIAVMIVIWNNPEQGAKREIAQRKQLSSAQQRAAPAAHDAARNAADDRPGSEELAKRSDEMSIHAAPPATTMGRRKNPIGSVAAKPAGERSNAAGELANEGIPRDTNLLAKEGRSAQLSNRAKTDANRSPAEQASSMAKNDEAGKISVARGKGTATGIMDGSPQLADAKVAEKQKVMAAGAAGRSSKNMLAANAGKGAPSAAEPQGTDKSGASQIGRLVLNAPPGAASALGAGAGRPVEEANALLVKPGGKADLKRNADADDRFLIVRCDVVPAAVREHAFDKLLQSNGIVTTHQEKADSLRADEKAARRQDVVQVAATPDQIAAILSQLRARHDAFPAVSVEPAGRALWQREVAEYNDRADGDKKTDRRGFGGGQSPAAADEGKKKSSTAKMMELKPAPSGKGAALEKAPAKPAVATYRVMFVLRRVDLPAPPAPPANTAPAKQKQ